MQTLKPSSQFWICCRTFQKKLNVSHKLIVVKIFKKLYLTFMRKRQNMSLVNTITPWPHHTSLNNTFLGQKMVEEHRLYCLGKVMFLREGQQSMLPNKMKCSLGKEGTSSWRYILEQHCLLEALFFLSLGNTINAPQPFHYQSYYEDHLCWKIICSYKNIWTLDEPMERRKTQSLCHNLIFYEMNYTICPLKKIVICVPSKKIERDLPIRHQ